MIGPRRCLVDPFSATSCLPPETRSKYSLPIPRTHSDLVKFTQHDEEYKNVIFALHQILENPTRGSRGDEMTEKDLDGLADLRTTDPGIDRRRFEEASRNWSKGSYQSHPEDPETTGPYKHHGMGSASGEDRYATGVPSRGDSHAIDDETKTSLIKQLYFAKIDERLTALTAAQGETCRWFLSNPAYISWLDVTQQSKHGGFLWIKGHPGTGKSTLMKLLFEEVWGGTRDDPLQITLSFFFVARGTIEEKSTMGLYRSLLHQLFRKARDLEDSLEWMTADGAKGVQQNGWHEEALKRTLMRAVSNLGSRLLTIFVDALDECDQSQVVNMVCFFEELCDHARVAQAQLRICFSSRHYPAVVIGKGIEVTLEAESGHTDDIKHYIRSKLRLGKAKHAETLRSEILEKSRGIFLWVVLVLDILNAEYPNSSVSINGIRRRLKQIPPGLNELFELVLTRDGTNLEQLHICLKWILFAARPLRAEELYSAVQLGLDPESPSDLAEEEIDLDQIKAFVGISSKGLAQAVATEGWWSPEVQFIHESVRDFLLGRYREQWPEASGSFEGHCHNMLRDCCSAQLNAIHQGAEASAVARFPFLDYATRCILRHSNSAQQHGVEQGGFLAAFPLPKWLRLRFAFAREGPAFERRENSVWLLHYLAEKNLAALARILARTVSCFDVEGGKHGPPIFAARATGNHEAVEAMLEGLQPHIQHPDSPLFDFWERRDPNQTCDYSPYFKFSPRRGVLSHLVEEGDETVMAAFLLSSDKAEVNVGDDSGRTPLSWAAQSDNEGVVKLLLAAGADVNVRDKGGRTPVLWATASWDNRPTVELLLAAGAEVNIQDKNGRTPLSNAAQSGDGGTMERLLAAGAQIDVRDSNGRTPLSWAAENYDENGTKLLLAAGAEVDAEDEDGRTPLSWAAQWSSEGTIKSLIVAGAKVDTRDHDGRTQLSWAAEEGNRIAISLLLAAGAEVDAEDNCGRTPLWWAHNGEELRAAEVLLAAGAAPDKSIGPLLP